MRLPLALTLSALLVCGPALGVGSDDTAPPKPSPTTIQCKGAQIWDERTKRCMDARSGALDDDARFAAVRELSHAGRPEDALAVLAAMQEGETDRVLTYLGFANRLAGRRDAGMAWYALAIDRNPDNILARSYFGQALVLDRDLAGARAQLAEIRARGGAGSWAETALVAAIRSGRGYSY